MRRWNIIAMLAAVTAAIAGMITESPAVMRFSALAVCAISVCALIEDSETYAVCVPETIALGACLWFGAESSMSGYRCVMMCTVAACAFFACGALGRMPLPQSFRRQSIVPVSPAVVSCILICAACAALAWPLITYVTGIRGTQADIIIGRFADMLRTMALPAAICACALIQGPIIGAAALALLLTCAAYRPEMFTELVCLSFAASLFSLARGKGIRKWIVPVSVPVTVAALVYTGMVHMENIIPDLAEPYWLTDVLYASYGWPGMAVIGLAVGAAAYFCASGLRGRTLTAVPCMAVCVFGAKYLMSGTLPSTDTLVMTAASYGICLIADTIKGGRPDRRTAGNAPSRRRGGDRFHEEAGRRPRRRR